MSDEVSWPGPSHHSSLVTHPSLFAPVFLFLGGQVELERVGVDDLELGAALGALDDLALLDVVEGELGLALGAGGGHHGGHGFLLLLQSCSARMARSRQDRCHRACRATARSGVN